MRTRCIIWVACLLVCVGSAPAAAEKASKGPPPALDSVVWDDQPITLNGLRGKTVIVLAYATRSESLNSGPVDEMLAQLKAAIAGKPVVVLAINADKKTGNGPGYLREHKFTAPNIISGWDPLMPARWGAKDDYFQFAWIDPEGRLFETESALAWYEQGASKEYMLSYKLGRARKLGTFTVLDTAMPPKVRELLWPLELGRTLSDAELKPARQTLAEADQQALDVAIERFLKAELEAAQKLAKGEPGDQLLAYEKASRLAANFKGREEARQGKELAAELAQDKELKPELAAKRAYDKALQLAAKSPANRGRLLSTVAKTFKGTYYGQRAAEEVNPSAPASRPKSIHTWPELTAAQQEAALKEQRAFLEEIRQKVPGRGLQAYETERFLFFSDLPGNIITTRYLPYLDEMYKGLCGAFGLDPTKNLWKGKATIVAYTNDVDFQTFQETFFSKPSHLHAQGCANCASDGRVVIGCAAGMDPSYFAVVLVHETTHGFEWRYRSGDHVPNWLNEGAAEWIANRVVSTDKEIRHKVERAIRQMKQTHSLGGDFFTAQNIAAWQYGAAASITDFLISNSQPPQAKGSGRAGRGKAEMNRYRKLIDGIKDGLPWESALQEAYGLTPEQLAQAYGQSIGIPDLRP